MARVKKAMAVCQCGCGGHPRGINEFLSGHDTKLQSSLIRTIELGGSEAVEAAGELAARDWIFNGPAAWGMAKGRTPEVWLRERVDARLEGK